MKKGIGHSQHIMMDSGAFSVWNTGAEIDLNAYIKFCKEYKDCIDTVIALDVIPGRKGEPRPGAVEIERTAKEGWENYLKMIKGGIPADKIVPVFHQFDDFKWLKLFVEKKVPYIGLGWLKQGVNRVQQQAWLDTCMNYVTDSNGITKAKLHGFGITSMAIVLRYPWHSVDSTTALKQAFFGSVFIPQQKNGGWFFLHTPRSVNVSSKSATRFIKNQHLLTLPKRTQDVCLKWFAEAGVPFGKSEYSKQSLDYKHIVGKEQVYEKHSDHKIIEHMTELGVLNSYSFRTQLNCYFFERVAQELSGIERRFMPEALRRQSLFALPEVKKHNKDNPVIDRIRIFMAGSMGKKEWQDHPAAAPVPNRLLSYYGINKEQEFQDVINERRS
jgi:hypothetical protein